MQRTAAPYGRSKHATCLPTGSCQAGALTVPPKIRSNAQTLDGAELDFSRYGDVLFEVVFAGARLTTGGNVSTEGKPLDFNVRARGGGEGVRRVRA